MRRGVDADRGHAHHPAMQKLVAGLSLATLALAGSTLYFWRELAAERDAHRVAVIPASQAVATAVAATLPDGGHGPAPPAPPTGANTAAAKAPAHSARSREEQRAQSAIDFRKQMAAAAPAFLASLDDPQKRAAMAADFKKSIRTSAPDFQRYVGLSDEAFDRLLDTMAELEITGRESASRCALDPNCSFPNWDQATRVARRHDALAPFGQDVIDKYDFYFRSGAERQFVTEFRGRLDDATRLTDAQSQKLARALADANEEIRDGLAAADKVNSIEGMAYSEITYEGDPPGPDRSEEIAGYNRRLRDAAASVLTAAQLAAFEQMQSQAVEESRGDRPRRRN